jgi:hypothetical protein
MERKNREEGEPTENRTLWKQIRKTCLVCYKHDMLLPTQGILILSCRVTDVNSYTAHSDP